MVNLKRILLTTDLSEESLAALDYANTLSLLYGARLTVLHVDNVTPPAMYTIHVPDYEGGQFQHDALDHARKALEEFARIHIPSSVNIVLEVRLGKPVEEINRYVEEAGIDLIVMATHGRTGLKHVMMGSVAEKVVRTASVPVLTVKPRKLRDRMIQIEDIEDELHVG
jgi:nucleotide-binding universal stress UspA family protein